MRVCHLITHNPNTIGGIETVALELGKGYDIKWIGSGGVFSIIKGFIVALKLRFSNYDIIHTHDNAGYWCSYLTKNKILVYTNHGFWKDYFDVNKPTNLRKNIESKILVRMQNRIIKHFDSVVPITNDISEKLKKYYNILPYFVIHNGVDAQKFHTSNKRKNFDYIWIGTNAGSKRLKESIEFVFNQNKNLLVVGVFGKNTDKIKYISSVKRDEIHNILNLAKTFVYFNKQKAYSLALLEAMSCGLNIVTNDYILSELTKEGKIDGTIYLDNEPKKIVKLNGELARKIIESEFDWNIIRNKYKRFYETLTNR